MLPPQSNSELQAGGNASGKLRAAWVVGQRRHQGAWVGLGWESTQAGRQKPGRGYGPVSPLPHAAATAGSPTPPVRQPAALRACSKADVQWAMAAWHEIGTHQPLLPLSTSRSVQPPPAVGAPASLASPASPALNCTACMIVMIARFPLGVEVLRAGGGWLTAQWLAVFAPLLDLEEPGLTAGTAASGGPAQAMRGPRRPPASSGRDEPIPPGAAPSLQSAFWQGERRSYVNVTR